jgi:hypothetical protein
MKRKLLSSSITANEEICHNDNNYNNQHHLSVSFDKIQWYDYSNIPRILQSDFPREVYRRRCNEVKNAVHWGQRKLLISEIEFLTKYGEPDITCVYAGAAPGIHIPYLSSLFPNIKFILIDPREFYFTSHDLSKNITLYNDIMTDTLAQTFIHHKTLLISDIRSIDYTNVTSSEMDQEITNDMLTQMTWHKIMKPIATMLKFRLPWTEGKTFYLSGDIYLPIWGPQTTTESRLIIDNLKYSSNEMIEYDHCEYWEKMFYFNNIIRSKCAYHNTKEENNVVGSKCNWMYDVGMDNCYDCYCEIMILKEYLLSIHSIYNNDNNDNNNTSNENNNTKQDKEKDKKSELQCNAKDTTNCNFNIKNSNDDDMEILLSKMVNDITINCRGILSEKTLFNWR